MPSPSFTLPFSPRDLSVPSSPASAAPKPAQSPGTRPALPLKKDDDPVIYESKASNLFPKGKVQMRITFGALNAIVSDSDKVDILRSLVGTFINDPVATFIPIKGEGKDDLFFEFEHNQNGVPRRYLECTCQLKKDTLQVDKLSVEERIESDEDQAEMRHVFDIDFSSDDAQTIPTKRKASPMQAGLLKKLEHDNTRDASQVAARDLSEAPSTDADGTYETDYEYDANRAAASEPADRTAFTLPDSMKLSAHINKHIDALQEELNADPNKSSEEKAAGPSFTALFKRLKDKEMDRHKHLTCNKDLHLTVRYLDGYRTNLAESLLLKDVLADAVSYLDHASKAKSNSSLLRSSYIYEILDDFYPDSPVRQKIKELLINHKTWKNLKANPRKVTEYMRIGTQIDAYLAKQKLHFADVCALEDQDKFTPANQERRTRFLAMRDAMMKTAPTNSAYKDVLKTLRVVLHPVDQDKDLKKLINNAAFDDGAKLLDSSQTQWRGIAPLLAEVLFDGKVSVEEFIGGVRAFAKETGTTANRLEKFRKAAAPFANSKLNYAAIVKKVAPTTFEILVTHILNNKCMETTLQERPEPQG